MILGQFQVSSSDILNGLYGDCSQNPNAQGMSLSETKNWSFLDQGIIY